MSESGWRRLLSQISERLVVPVIGPQLMVSDDSERNLQHDLAQRLRVLHDLDTAEPLPRYRELNAVVSEIRQKNPHTKLQDVYGDVCDLIQEILSNPGLVIPEPVRQIAEIADFDLLVTLTPDDLLARALRRRIAVREIVHSPYLPTSMKDADLPADWRERQAEVHLLYLFGKASQAPQFAIHDEDVLEYAHNVIARGSHSRERFFGELRDRNLLLLGSNFPDWLGRFFLRATNKQRLLADNNKRDWLVDEPQGDGGLTLFLRSFSHDTEVLTNQSPRAFVAELHRRWTAAHAVREEQRALARASESEAAAQQALFFISYSRTRDKVAAEALVSYLRNDLRLSAQEVWYDRNAIEPGDRFARSIQAGIASCEYFIPLISRESDALTETYFRREWKAAIDREQAIMGKTFIVPQIVDADFVPNGYRNVPPEWINGLHFGHCPGGVPTTDTAAHLKKLVRAFRETGQ
ncbi:toll/interleukin-1 receptor domain-containing protein [Aquabacterium humicola]|uniref:toll/interleukin-1 receptor domain-containing protein n=1 Tax=Aquabacterium humicola TaxID=3237377 RepID=UPI002542BD80|nr:toll/interleukin-1 receptor domain-containing protein [Rubrivivax pictus]